MKIKFGDKDPRAGMVATMDSIRGRELVDSGAATEVKENVDADEARRAPSTTQTEVTVFGGTGPKTMSREEAGVRTGAADADVGGRDTVSGGDSDSDKTTTTTTTATRTTAAAKSTGSKSK